jgi:hypothetical protein
MRRRPEELSFPGGLFGQRGGGYDERVIRFGLNVLTLLAGFLTLGGCTAPLRVGIGPTVTYDGVVGFQAQFGTGFEFGNAEFAVGSYQELALQPHRGDIPTSGNFGIGLGGFLFIPDLQFGLEAGFGYAAHLPSWSANPDGSTVPSESGLSLHLYGLRSLLPKQGGSKRGLNLLLGGGLKYQHYFPEQGTHGLFFLPLLFESRLAL